MKQTVEEAAREYAYKARASFVGITPEEYEEQINPEYPYNIGTDKDFESLFIAGAEWQAKKSPWIKVKDKLPPVNENDVSKQSDPVLVQLASKEWFEPQILVYNKYYHVWDSEDGDDYECEVSENDLWMPIPELPKGGEE